MVLFSRIPQPEVFITDTILDKATSWVIGDAYWLAWLGSPCDASPKQLKL